MPRNKTVKRKISRLNGRHGSYSGVLKVSGWHFWHTALWVVWLSKTALCGGQYRSKWRTQQSQVELLFFLTICALSDSLFPFVLFILQRFHFPLLTCPKRWFIVTPLSQNYLFYFFVKRLQRFYVSLCLPDLLFSLGPLYCDCRLPAFLLPGVLLLGADRGVAVLPGRHWQNEVATHSQAFSVPRLGWAPTTSHITKHKTAVGILAPDSDSVLVLRPGHTWKSLWNICL